jgi:hypothetical protein
VHIYVNIDQAKLRLEMTRNLSMGILSISIGISTATSRRKQKMNQMLCGFQKAFGTPVRSRSKRRRLRAHFNSCYTAFSAFIKGKCLGIKPKCLEIKNEIRRLQWDCRRRCRNFKVWQGSTRSSRQNNGCGQISKYQDLNSL